jgi:DinB superfamily
MDLGAWLLDAHTDLRTRLFGSVVQHVPVERWHERADGGGSSITWLLLHLARHHDLALSTSIRDKDPIFLAHRDALGVGASFGAGLTEREDRDVSAAVSAEPLITYVHAVFDASEKWLQHLSAMALDTIPDTPRRLEHRAGLDPELFPWLYQMWTGRPVHWFVQWPVLGHGNAHVGEAISVRNRMGLSPF